MLSQLYCYKTWEDELCWRDRGRRVEHTSPSVLTSIKGELFRGIFPRRSITSTVPQYHRQKSPDRSRNKMHGQVAGWHVHIAVLFVLPSRSASFRNRTTEYWVGLFSWLRRCKLLTRGQADFTAVINFALTHWKLLRRGLSFLRNFRLLSDTYSIHPSF